MSGKETITRKDIIDKRLQTAGWNVSKHTQVVDGFDIDVRVRLGVLSPTSQTNFESPAFSFPKNSLTHLLHSRSPYWGSTSTSAAVIDHNTFRLFKAIAIGQKYTYGI